MYGTREYVYSMLMSHSRRGVGVGTLSTHLNVIGLPEH